ncbi:TPA: hypothetical protein VDB83_005165 [Burkholderia cenocepacia]|nr:hypothetical protein [Burkholderia cenocepacia]
MSAEQQGHDDFVAFSSDAYNVGFSLTLYVDGGVRSSAALMSVNKALAKPFGHVPLAVRALAFALQQDGYPIECSAHGNSWIPVTEPKFEAMKYYRLLLKPDMPEAPVTEPHSDEF